MDCCDLSLFQLPLGQEGGGKFKYARCHYVRRFFMEVVPKSSTMLIFATLFSIVIVLCTVLQTCQVLIKTLVPAG